MLSFDSNSITQLEDYYQNELDLLSSELKDIKIDCSDIFVENFDQNTSDISDLGNSEKAKNEEIYSNFEKKNELIQQVNAPSLNYEDLNIQNISCNQCSKLSSKEIENSVCRTSTDLEIKNPNIDIMKISYAKKSNHELKSSNKEQNCNNYGIDVIKEKIDKKVIEDSYNIDLNLTVDLIFINHEADNNTTKKIKCRFGKNEDRDLFNRLKSICNKHKININEFWSANGPLNSSLQKLLNEEFFDISSTRHKDFLLKRIRKIGRNVNFSVREQILLKKLLKKQKYREQINYSKLEYYLPGKTEDIIKKEIDSFNNI